MLRWNDRIARTSVHIYGNKRVPDGVRVVILAAADFSVYEWHLLIKVKGPGWPGKIGWTWEPIRHRDAVKLGCGFQDSTKETSLEEAKRKSVAAAEEYLRFASHPQSCNGNKSR